MSRYLTIDDLAAMAVPEQPALSPDGTRIVYALRTFDLQNDRVTHRLWTVGVAGGEPVKVTNGPSDTAPAWSPDGTRLAFLRVDGGPAQVWLMPAAGGEAKCLTTLPLGAGEPIWSPDGSKLAFTAPVDLLAVDGEPDDARVRRESAPIVADRLDYRADGEGLRFSRRKHVHVVDVESGKCTQLTGGDWDAGSPAWSPGGSKLAFPAAMDADADLNGCSAAYVVDLASGIFTPQLAGSPAGLTAALSWTADGSALLVAGTAGSPEAHFSLLRIAASDGTTTDLSAALDRNVMFGSSGYPGATPRALGDGTVLFCVRDRGCTHLYSVDEAGGTPVPVVAGESHQVSGLSAAAGRAAFLLTTPSSFGEVASVELGTGAVSVHTAHGQSLAGVQLYPRMEREFHISDGTVVHGWLMRDPSAAGHQPVLLDIHGGPHNAWNGAADEVHLYHHELAAKGWIVLLLNPRGSDGYGEAFFTAVNGAWGIADAQDLLEPLDELFAEGVADPARLAVTGYSYGGYMTCYLTSRDSRFAAAVTGGPVSDLTSMAGTSDNRHSLSESSFGGSAWADRPHYAAMNPMACVECVDTPTLVLQGDADARCPVGQAQQWHTALRERGVPTRLVLYPGSSHTFIINGRPSHRLDYNRRVADWVERYAG